ncbi:MAG: helix-turn-helix domain-containing protein [Geminicoccaceae bacterium]
MTDVELFQTALLSGLIGCLGLTAGLVATACRPERPANLFLLAFLVGLAIIAVSDLLDLVGLYGRAPLLEVAVGPVVRAIPLLLAPLLFAYFQTEIHGLAARPRFWLHTLPAFIAWVAFLPVNAPDGWQGALFETKDAVQAFSLTIIRLFWLVLFISAGVYLWASFKLLHERVRSLRNLLSAMPDATMARTRNLWAIISLPILSIGIEFLSARLFAVPFAWQMSGSVFRVVCLVLFCGFVLRSFSGYGPPDEEKDALELQKRVKYERAPMAHDEAERLSNKLVEAMRVNHLHRNPLLSLRDVAAAIRAPDHKVSQLLSSHLNTNFFDFVNSWRVEEAKRLLDEPTPMTVLDISIAVGFNARSTFYSAFRKVERMTPTEYRRRQAVVSRSVATSALSSHS